MMGQAIGKVKGYLFGAVHMKGILEVKIFVPNLEAKTKKKIAGIITKIAMKFLSVISCRIKKRGTLQINQRLMMILQTMLMTMIPREKSLLLFPEVLMIIGFLIQLAHIICFHLKIGLLLLNQFTMPSRFEVLIVPNLKLKA